MTMEAGRWVGTATTVGRYVGEGEAVAVGVLLLTVATVAVAGAAVWVALG
jgi:hypothetical protein